MTERDFLSGYDPTAFPAVAVAVDLVALTVDDGKLQLLLVQRTEHPAKGRWALPGSILQSDEDLDACALRTAREKAGLSGRVRQFQAFSDPARDPRLRMVSIGYLLLASASIFSGIVAERTRLISILSRDGEIVLRGDDRRRIALPFDHDEIVRAAVTRLRVDLDRTTDVFSFLPEEFTLRDLQIVHEAVRAETLNRPAFRKRMLDSGRLEATGRKETESGFRPAELYRLRAGAA